MFQSVRTLGEVMLDTHTYTHPLSMISLSAYINPPELLVYKNPKLTCPLPKEDSKATYTH